MEIIKSQNDTFKAIIMNKNQLILKSQNLYKKILKSHHCGFTGELTKKGFGLSSILMVILFYVYQLFVL